MDSNVKNKSLPVEQVLMFQTELLLQMEETMLKL